MTAWSGGTRGRGVGGKWYVDDVLQEVHLMEISLASASMSNRRGRWANAELLWILSG